MKMPRTWKALFTMWLIMGLGAWLWMAGQYLKLIFAPALFGSWGWYVGFLVVSTYVLCRLGWLLMQFGLLLFNLDVWLNWEAPGHRYPIIGWYKMQRNMLTLYCWRLDVTIAWPHKEK